MGMAVAAVPPPPPAGPPAAQLLSAAWPSVIAARVGHENAEVMAEGEGHVSVTGLQSSVELYHVALEMAQHGEVHWIAPQAPLVPSNYFAKQVVQSGMWWDLKGGTYKVDGLAVEPPIEVYTPLSAIGLTGKGQVVGVADTGLDWNSCFFKDDEIRPQFKWDDHKRAKKAAKGKYETWSTKKHRKIRQYVAYMNGWEDEDDGHGTHISGSIAGNCEWSGEEGIDKNRAHNGVAPDAKIALFDMYSAKKKEERNPGILPETIMSSSYDVGARVYTFAFNEGPTALPPNFHYNEAARRMDDFSHEHGDFLILISAGNDGGRVASPANAKNVLTVGSHYNPHPSITYTPEAAAQDILAPAPYSARGPTTDGRTKPEVYGPGSTVTSAASKGHEDILTTKKHSPSSTTPAMRLQPLVNPNVEHCRVVAKDGTSSATAIVAGAAVLVRQYFTEGYYPNGKKNKLMPGFNPMAALIKAVLVNSARPLTVNGEETPSAEHDPLALGWGGVNIASTLVTPHSPEGLQLKVYGTWSDFDLTKPVIFSNQKAEFPITTTTTSGPLPLKITLVWLDMPSDPRAVARIIYDLDLQVQESLGKGKRGGPIFYPNGRKEPDHTNTVEHIHIAEPKPNTDYVITVKSSGLPGMISYALVISGPFNSKKVTRSKKSDKVY